MSSLVTQIEQAQRRLKDLQARARIQQRKDETRRLILYGAASLAHLETLDGEKRKADAIEKLHAKITRSGDRAFLGLDPLPEEEANDLPSRTAPLAPEDSERSKSRDDRAAGLAPPK